MFSKTVVDSDDFMELPLSSQALYFHLGMEADDEGFLNCAKKVLRMVGCSNDDFKLLIAKGFLIPFESGVVVIRHWNENNSIRKDRFNQTAFIEEKNQLVLSGNVYNVNQMTTICQPNANQVTTKCQPSDNHLPTQVKLSKDKISKDKISNSIDAKASITETLNSDDEELIQTVIEWVEYKKEKRQGYKPTGLKSLLTQIKNNVERYGSDAVIQVIRSSMSSNYQGIVFDRLKGGRSNGGNAVNSRPIVEREPFDWETIL